MTGYIRLDYNTTNKHDQVIFLVKITPSKGKCLF